MKRNVFLKNFMSLFKKNDVVMVNGKELCEDVITYAEDPNCLLLDDEVGHASAMALGVALATPKRVFFICEEHYALRNLNSLANLAASKRPNIFVIVLASGVYPDMNACPVLGGGISLKGVLFNMGFKAYGYTGHFKTVAEAKKVMPRIFKFLKGPTASIINVEPRTTGKKLKLDRVKMAHDYQKFVMDDLGSSLFNPPVVVMDFGETYGGISSPE
jgi:hypothetical protein